MKYIYFIAAIFNFLIFIYDLENDKDVYTWLWLLHSVIFFIFFLNNQIKNIITKHFKDYEKDYFNY